MRWERKLLGTKPDHNSQCSARACSRKSTGAEMTGSPLTGLRQGAAPGCQTFQERRDTQPRKSVRVGASPTCDLFILCLSLSPRFPSPCFYPAVPVSTVPWLAPPAPPQARSPLSHQNSVCCGRSFVYCQSSQACHWPNTTKPGQGGLGSRCRLAPQGQVMASKPGTQLKGRLPPVLGSCFRS